MENFSKKLSVDFFNKTSPISFAHKKSVINPQDFSLHLNDCVEIYTYISGDADYVVGNECIKLSRGDVIAISPYEIHTPVFNHECEYERFYILFPLNSFPENTFNPLKLFTDKSEKTSAKLNLSYEEKEEILKILYSLSKHTEKEKSDVLKLSSSGLILQFLNIITSALLKNPDSSCTEESLSEINPVVRDILTYISLNPEAIGSVKDVANHFFISAPYLSSLFKKHVGINVSSYIRIKKIGLAKKLLDSGISVTDACYRCGFSDCSYFIKIFKEYVGITPYHYKNKITGI